MGFFFSVLKEEYFSENYIMKKTRKGRTSTDVVEPTELWSATDGG